MATAMSRQQSGRKDAPLDFQYCRTPPEFFRLAFDKLKEATLPQKTIAVVKDDISSYFAGNAAKPAKIIENFATPLSEHLVKTAEATETALTPLLPTWHRIIQENLKHLVKITAGRRQTNISRLNKTIQMLSDGISSTNEPIASSSCQSTIAYVRSVNRLSADFRPFFWTWFSQPGAGLNIIEACHLHHDLRRVALIEILLAFVDTPRLTDFFKDSLPVKLGSPLSYLSFVHELLDISNADQILALFVHPPGVFQHVVDFALHYAGPGSDVEVRFEAISLIGKIWVKLPRQVEHVRRRRLSDGVASVADSMLDTLRMACRDPRTPQVQIVAHAALFLLWDAAANQAIGFNGGSSSSVLRVLWDMLVFSMFGNRSFEHVYFYIVSSFCRWLPNRFHNEIDLGPVVEQMGRQVKISGLVNVDIDLLLVVAQHSALTAIQGVMLLELVGQLAVSDVVYGRLATTPFIVLLCRFKREPAVVTYLKGYVCALIGSLRNQDDIDQLSLSSSPSEYYKRLLVIEVLAKVLHLRHEEFESVVDEVKDMLWTCVDSHEDLKSLGYFIAADKDQ